jgi:hypothetical protein
MCSALSFKCTLDAATNAYDDATNASATNTSLTTYVIAIIIKARNIFEPSKSNCHNVVPSNSNFKVDCCHMKDDEGVINTLSEKPTAHQHVSSQMNQAPNPLHADGKASNARDELEFMYDSFDDEEDDDNKHAPRDEDEK